MGVIVKPRHFPCVATKTARRRQVPKLDSTGAGTSLLPEADGPQLRLRALSDGGAPHDGDDCCTLTKSLFPALAAIQGRDAPVARRAPVLAPSATACSVPTRRLEVHTWRLSARQQHGHAHRRASVRGRELSFGRIWAFPFAANIRRCMLVNPCLVHVQDGAHDRSTGVGSSIRQASEQASCVESLVPGAGGVGSARSGTGHGNGARPA